ncbi:MAG TPA: LysR substrate-binding domain-containing protein [Ktedonobacterales bacterium]|nr:LysR substrate-binding domain-containing protein [Ktedonobacterales bacterium]
MADLKPHQLDVFCAVAQHLSYGRAAESLYLSQPAVSQQIKALQATLGLRLFARSGRGIVLAPAGAKLLPHAKRLLALLADTAPVVSDIHALERGSVLIGASMSTGAYVVPRLLAGFHAARPQIRLTLKVANRLTIEADLLTRRIDLAVIGLVKHHAPFVIEPLVRHDLIVVAPPQHRLAGRASIPLRELQWEPFLLREPGSGTRMDTEHLFARVGLALRAAHELGDTGAIKEAVGAGLGIAVLFRQSVAAELARGELVELEVDGFPLERRWHVVHLRERHLSIAAAALRAHMLSQAIPFTGAAPA